MDLTIKKAVAKTSQYSNQNVYMLPYEEKVLELPSPVENIAVGNSSFDRIDQYSPLPNSFSGNNNISNYKRPRSASDTENRSSPNDDSGIDLTPKKLCLLPASECDQSLSDQEYAFTKPADTHGMIASSTATTTPDIIKNSAKKFKHMLEPTTVDTLKLSTITALTLISKEKLSNICAYHGNMVRQFPQKERSAKEQELRNKNTIACRMSRRLKKLAEIAVEEQCKENEQQLKQLLQQKLRVSAFLVQLMEMNRAAERNNENANVVAEAETEIDVVSLDDVSTNEVPIYGEWKYNVSVRKIQWHNRTFVATPTLAPVRPNKASDFSIDSILAN